MARLSRYLLRLFWSEAMALFAVAAFLLFLIQCLRLFDVVSDKGQSLLTLVGQALLGMPALAIVFLYVCLGIGLGRALRNLQGSSELGVIHSNGLLSALLRAIALYTLMGAVLLMVLAHVADPLSVRASNQWSSSIAADLVSRSMIPHKFTELQSGVSMVIGARDLGGNITDFFADDTRDPAQRRTYFAKSAIISHDDEGYVLRMHDGAVQYMTDDQRFSQVSFQSYDLALDRLTGSVTNDDPLASTPSFDLVRDALFSGHWSSDVVKTLWRRSAEGLRVIAMCLFVAALAAFPSGKRRGFEVPIEMAALGVAFVERAITSYFPVGPGLIAAAPGAIAITLIGLVLMGRKLRIFQRVPIRRRAMA
jgi:lipopolysaccharide export system permease protein